MGERDDEISGTVLHPGSPIDGPRCYAHDDDPAMRSHGHFMGPAGVPAHTWGAGPSGEPGCRRCGGHFDTGDRYLCQHDGIVHVTCPVPALDPSTDTQGDAAGRVVRMLETALCVCGHKVREHGAACESCEIEDRPTNHPHPAQKRCSRSYGTFVVDVRKVLAARPVPAATHTDPAAQARAWDEGAEATAEWMANNPGPSGIPHDPPQNPYHAAQAPAPTPGQRTVQEYGLRGADGTIYDGANEGMRWTREDALRAADADPDEGAPDDVLIRRTVTTTPDVVTEWVDA